MKTKHTKAFFLLVTLGLSFAGCDSGDKRKVEVNVNQAGIQLEKPATNLGAAVDARTEFVAAMNKRIGELDAQMAELTRKSENLQDDARIQADRKLDTLNEQRRQVKAQFENLKKAGTDGWNETKAAFVAAVDEFEKSVEKTKTQLN